MPSLPAFFPAHGMPRHATSTSPTEPRVAQERRDVEGAVFSSTEPKHKQLIAALENMEVS